MDSGETPWNQHCLNMAIQRMDRGRMEGDMKSRFIRRTLNFWQPRYSRELKNEDARQITENAVGFFRVLQEWEAGRVRRIRKLLTILRYHSYISNTILEGEANGKKTK